MSELLEKVKRSKCGAVILETYTEKEINEVDAWLKQHGLDIRETIYDSWKSPPRMELNCRLSFLCGDLDLDIWAGRDNHPYIALEKGGSRIMIKWRGKPIFGDWLGYKLGQGLSGTVESFNREEL